MTDWPLMITQKAKGELGLLTCDNPGSFEVSISEQDGDFLVGYDGWHEHFSDLKPALNCFAFGLSEECRLKVTLRGQLECSWTVQSWTGEGWKDASTIGLILIPFWRARRTEYRLIQTPPVRLSSSPHALPYASAIATFIAASGVWSAQVTSWNAG